MNVLGVFDAGNISDTLQIPFKELGGGGGLLSAILALALVLAGLFFLLYFLVGGLQWLTSGGDKAHLESARGKITNALIGLVIIIAAFAIMTILEAMFGIRILSGFRLSGPNPGPSPSP